MGPLLPTTTNDANKTDGITLPDAPPIDLFKSIFASDEELSGESDEDNDGETEPPFLVPSNNISPPTNSTTTTSYAEPSVPTRGFTLTHPLFAHLFGEGDTDGKPLVPRRCLCAAPGFG